MRRTAISALSAVTAVAAFSLCGCSRDPVQPSSGPPATTTTTAPVPPADPGPLPAPEALSDVVARLADPAVPGPDKLALVHNAAPADTPVLDNFATALRDTGFAPVTVSATEIRWSDDHPGNVLATITVTGGDSGADATAPDGFAYPMEFQRTSTGWQLTRETADMLLAFGDTRTDAPGPPPPGPTPPP